MYAIPKNPAVASLPCKSHAGEPAATPSQVREDTLKLNAGRLQWLLWVPPSSPLKERQVRLPALQSAVNVCRILTPSQALPIREATLDGPAKLPATLPLIAQHTTLGVSCPRQSQTCQLISLAGRQDCNILLRALVWVEKVSFEAGQREAVMAPPYHCLSVPGYQGTKWVLQCSWLSDPMGAGVLKGTGVKEQVN